MNLIYLLQNIIELFLILIGKVEFFLFLLIIIGFYHFLLMLFRDRKFILSFRRYKDNEFVKFEDFSQLPLINIIIPAWKEGEIFRGCIDNLLDLRYPNLKIVINAGGNEKTISISNSFKKYKNIEVLIQKQGEGKVKAINDGISHVSDGLVCLIDADIYLKDVDLLNMLYVIMFKDEKVVASDLKPHQTQIRKNIVRYSYINRNTKLRNHFRRYTDKSISQCTLLKLSVIKKVGNFSEKRLIGDGQSIGADIEEKDLKIYHIKSNGVQCFNYPGSLREYFSQNVRWLQNSYYIRINAKRSQFFRFIFLSIKSLLLFIFPFLLFIDINFVSLWILLLITIYLKKVRKIIFFKETTDKNYFGKNQISFYLLIVFYMYLDAFIISYTFFEILFSGKKKFRDRKNIENNY